MLYDFFWVFLCKFLPLTFDSHALTRSDSLTVICFAQQFMIFYDFFYLGSGFLRKLLSVELGQPYVQSKREFSNQLSSVPVKKREDLIISSQLCPILTPPHWGIPHFGGGGEARNYS